MSAARVHALLLAALFFGASVGAYAHRAVVRHGYCSAHGEIVHLQPGQTLAPAADPDTATLGVQIRLDGAHACAALLFLAQATDLVGALPTGHRLEASQRPEVEAPAEPDRGIALLRLAPKSSPPR